MSQSCVFSTIKPDNLPLHYCLNIWTQRAGNTSQHLLTSWSDDDCTLKLQELPMDQTHLAGGDQHQTHLDR